MIRFELERALISGDLAVADLPDAWNAAYRQTSGIAPRTDAEGCLQDGHWADGMIGYFPTYTLGDVFAAQLFACAELELGSLGEQFARGEFGDAEAVARAAGAPAGRAVSLGPADRGGHGLAAGPPPAGASAQGQVRDAVRAVVRVKYSTPVIYAPVIPSNARDLFGPSSSHSRARSLAPLGMTPCRRRPSVMLVSRPSCGRRAASRAG